MTGNGGGGALSTKRARWRRLVPRLSVRGLIVLVLILGAWLGWIARRARVQRQAVAAIHRAGGSVRYDWEVRQHQGPFGGMTIPVRNTKPPWPEWLVDRLGVDYFGSVVEVEVFEGGSDALLREIGRLGRLDTLIFGRSNVTPAGLSQLRGLSRLERLYLGRTNVTDAGLAHLEGLTNLKGLGLDNTHVSDAGLVYLRGLTRLDQLDLSGTQVSDSGLVHLKGMADLRILSLDNTRVGDAGLTHLDGLTNLVTLYLRETRVTDAGIESLMNRHPSSLNVERVGRAE